MATQTTHEQRSTLIAARVSPTLAKRFGIVCDHVGRSRSDVIRELVDRWIADVLAATLEDDEAPSRPRADPGLELATAPSKEGVP